MPIKKTYYPCLPGQQQKLHECIEVDEEGVANGSYQSWWPNGQVKITAFKKNNCWHGHYVLKHPNGKTATECNYAEGDREGQYDEYFEDGTHKVSGFFRHDLENGYFLRWHSDGALWTAYHCKDGVLTGNKFSV